MSKDTYQLATFDSLLSHFPSMQAFANDIDDKDMLLHARVRSGDYLETIATELERSVQAMADNGITGAELEQIEFTISELLEANKLYDLVPKRT